MHRGPVTPKALPTGNSPSEDSPSARVLPFKVHTPGGTSLSVEDKENARENYSSRRISQVREQRGSCAV